MDIKLCLESHDNANIVILTSWFETKEGWIGATAAMESACVDAILFPSYAWKVRSRS